MTKSNDFSEASQIEAQTRQNSGEYATVTVAVRIANPV